jgi:hypothetical protein
MKAEILGVTPVRFGAPATDPRVVRLPDGNVRINGDAARFPERCPRCGRFPAKTEVRLHFTKFRSRGPLKGVSVKVPFCRSCGVALNSIPYVCGALSFVVLTFVLPHLKIPSSVRIIPDHLLAAVIAVLVSVVIERVPRSLIRPGVEVVAVAKGSADVAFDDQMYAEQLVLLNR